MGGIQFKETMAGSVCLSRAKGRSAAHDERAMSIAVTVRGRSHALAGFLRRPELELDGEVDVEGFADHCRLCGTVDASRVRTGVLPYTFAFSGNDGARYTFSGARTSFTILSGAVRDASGGEVGRALLRFDVMRDLVRCVLSLRASSS